jgi:integrase
MTGTITKRALKGGRFSWGYVFDAGHDARGKRIQVTKTGFSTKREAGDALRAAISKAELQAQKRVTPAIPTFAEFFARWMEEHASRRCSPKTLEAYGQHGTYAIREFGSVPINELTTELLETALNRMQDCGGLKGRPLAPKTIRHIFFVVSGALKKARKWTLLERNPMEDVDRPQKEAVAKRKPMVLDKEKMKLFLDSAETRVFYPLLVLAAATACRRGELFAPGSGSNRLSRASRESSPFRQLLSACLSTIGSNRMRSERCMAQTIRNTT